MTKRNEVDQKKWKRTQQLAQQGLNAVKEDGVEHPSHYVAGRKYEPWDVIMDWELNYFSATALKYISRYERKGEPVKDLRKAVVFLNKEIERLEKEKMNVQT